jgi:hypothetical protein
MGIDEHSVADFVGGCDLICDLVEFWAVGARILLHRIAMAVDIPILNCNTVGFGTRLFRFTPGGMPMEELLGIGYEDACVLQHRIQSKTATDNEVGRAMDAVLVGLVPELPEYGADPAVFSTVNNAHRRLRKERRAMIIATNPPMAAGFLSNHILFELLKRSPIKRRFITPPVAPGYLYFDAGFHEVRVVQRGGFHHA